MLMLTLAEFLSNATEVVAWGVTTMGTVGNMFLEPPYVYFVAIALFGTMVAMAGAFLLSRRGSAKKGKK